MIKTNIELIQFFRRDVRRTHQIVHFRNVLNLIHPVDGLLRHLGKDTEYAHRFRTGKKAERSKHQQKCLRECKVLIHQKKPRKKYDSCGNQAEA